MMLVSMLCWGSWANTQKIDKAWRFELYYWDYMWGILACALLFGLTLGRTNPSDPVSFFHNLDSASAGAGFRIETYGCGQSLRRHHHWNGRWRRNTRLPSRAIGKTNWVWLL
jgi:hypothetical protein